MGLHGLLQEGLAVFYLLIEIFPPKIYLRIPVNILRERVYAFPHNSIHIYGSDKCFEQQLQWKMEHTLCPVQFSIHLTVF
jgi:hypothetical protein